MKLALVGDMHGNHMAAKTAIYRAADLGAERIIFLGDFGYYFTAEFIGKLAKAAKKVGLIIEWLDGNHENFDKLTAMNFDLGPQFKYHPRGSVKYYDGVKFMFLGGATSVDRQWRKRGVNWWPQEQLSFVDIARGIANAPGTDIILSHDAPYLPPMMNDDLAPFPKVDLQISAMHRELYKMVYKEAKPKAVFHGHFHVPYVNVVTEPWGNVTITGLHCDGNAVIDYMTFINTEDYL